MNRKGETSGWRYCFNRESYKYHVADKGSRNYLCGCLGDFKISGKWRHGMVIKRSPIVRQRRASYKFN